MTFFMVKGKTSTVRVNGSFSYFSLHYEFNNNKVDPILTCRVEFPIPINMSFHLSSGR